jgi:hypothetical protein
MLRNGHLLKSSYFADDSAERSYFSLASRIDLRLKREDHINNSRAITVLPLFAALRAYTFGGSYHFYLQETNPAGGRNCVYQ